MSSKLYGAAVLAMVAIATGAQAGSPKRFDLICNGSAVDASEKDKAFTFLQRIRVDTTNGKFCTDDFCGAFTTQTATHFEYECTADSTLCPPAPKDGSASVKHEHFSFDWGSKAYSRTTEGMRGSPIPVAFRVDFSGACTFGAFSGLHPKG